MQIVFNTDMVPELRQRYTVLELETLTLSNGKTWTPHCILPAESLVAADLTKLSADLAQHERLIELLKTRPNADLAIKNLARGLIGAFGGELDSFYETLIERFQELIT